MNTDFDGLMLPFRKETFVRGALCDLGGETPYRPLRADSYPPMCTIVLDAGTKSGSPM